MNILQKLILKYPDKGWSWDKLSYNSNIDEKFIENNWDSPWEWGNVVTENKNITMEFIERNIEKLSDVNINKILQYNKNLTTSFIENHLELEWNLYWFSSNPNLTPEFLIKYKDMSWNWNWNSLEFH